jgi:hypothetical protein
MDQLVTMIPWLAPPRSHKETCSRFREKSGIQIPHRLKPVRDDKNNEQSPNNTINNRADPFNSSVFSAY